MITKVPMTVNGMSQLRSELERLKTQERPKVVKAIAEARAHGDLKENAEYHAAKEQQGFIEGRIRDIESKLANAQVIDTAHMTNKNIIVFGAIVHLLEIDTDKKLTYQIVGDDEANVKQGKISVNSPIARALIGKKNGDEVEVNVMNKKMLYEVEKIEY